MNLQEIASASALIKQELAPLAEKIGQGATYTFGLFVRQVYVNAITDLLWIIPGMFLLYVAKRLLSWKVENGWDSEMQNITKWTGIIVCLITGALMVIVPISGLIQALINPEYKAIQLIVELVKPNVK